MFLYWAMVEVLYQNDKQFLEDKIDVVSYFLAQPEYDQYALKHEILNVPFVLSNSIYSYYVRVINHKNQTIFETPGMKKTLSEADFFSPTQLHLKNNTKYSTWWFSPHGDKYLLMQSKMILDKKNNEVWLIQAALDVSYQHASLEQYRKNAIAVLLLGELFALIIGYLIANRSLSRLYSLIKVTKKISASSLHQRISTSAWPKELHELGLAYNQMLFRIEKSFSQLTQFADDLAHELRTPINNLMGQTEIALSDPAMQAEHKQVHESNLEELQRISQIIENILFLARAENPKLELKKVKLEVHDEIAVIAEFYAAIVEDKNIQLSIDGCASLMANQVMFRRMISNIFSNALKYTLAGGSICFYIKEINDQVEIIIRDSGVGIGQEHLPYIFDRFYRIDSARSAYAGNVGLGLSIVKSIVQLHRGSISVTSKLNYGTTITMRFPTDK